MIANICPLQDSFVKYINSVSVTVSRLLKAFVYPRDAQPGPHEPLVCLFSNYPYVIQVNRSTKDRDSFKTSTGVTPEFATTSYPVVCNWGVI